MDSVLHDPVRSFIDVMEVWVPEGDRLVPGGGHYGALSAFAETSRASSFAKGEGPPVIETGAGAAGCTAMVALPIHRGPDLAHIVAWYC